MRFNITVLVKLILEYCPETRDDDFLLWDLVMSNTPSKDFKNIRNMTVSDFLQKVKHMDIPQFETVSRARRKAQEHHPELRGTAATQEARKQLETEFRRFSKSRV